MPKVDRAERVANKLVKVFRRGNGYCVCIAGWTLIAYENTRTQTEARELRQIVVNHFIGDLRKAGVR